MNRQLCCILLVLATAIRCSAAQREQKWESDISEVLKQFSGYHLLTMSERNNDARAFLLHESSKTNPSIVRADFDGDGHADYAVLLKHDGDEKAKFVVLLCSENANCRSVYELDVTGVIAEMYLRPLPKGSELSETAAIDTHDDTTSAKLHTVGIQVNYLEKAAVVYYWSKNTGKIETIVTED